MGKPSKKQINALTDKENNPSLPTVERDSTLVDITPTWSAVLPWYFDILQNGTYEGKLLVKDEFKKMAAAADELNELAKKSVETQVNS